MVATRSRRRCEVALFAATEGDSLRDFPGKQVDGKRQIPGECSKNYVFVRSEEHTSELQSRLHLVCRLLLGKKKQISNPTLHYIFYAIICLKQQAHLHKLMLSSCPTGDPQSTRL